MCFTPLQQQQLQKGYSSSNAPRPNWTVRESDKVHPDLVTKNPATTEFSKNLIRMVQKKFNSDRPILFKTDDRERYVDRGRHAFQTIRGDVPVGTSQMLSVGASPLQTIIHEAFHSIDQTAISQPPPEKPTKKNAFGEKVPKRLHTESEKLDSLVEEFQKKVGKENINLSGDEKSKRLSADYDPKIEKPNVKYFMSKDEILARQFTEDFIRNMTDEDINSLTKDPEMRKSLKRQKEEYIKTSDKNKYQRDPKIVDQLKRIGKQQQSKSPDEIRQRDMKTAKGWLNYFQPIWK